MSGFTNLFFCVCLSLSLAPVSVHADKRARRDVRWARPLAQDYNVIFQTKQPDTYTAAGSLIKLPDGRLFSSYALFTRVGRESGHPDVELKTFFTVSDDGGKTWPLRGSLSTGDGLPFVHAGQLHFLCNGHRRTDILLAVSDDMGTTWSEPITLFKGRFWNTFTPHVVRGNTLYWAMGAANNARDFNRQGSRTVVVAADLTATTLMNPAAWRLSPFLTYPGTPPGLTTNLYPPNQPTRGDHWLEPNILNINGQLRVLLRLRLDSQATAHVCAVCEVNDDGTDIEYRFVQFHPMPGAQGYFYIAQDPRTGYFWTAVNMPTNSQDTEWGHRLNARGFLGNPGNERRILMLQYSIDGLN